MNNVVLEQTWWSSVPAQLEWPQPARHAPRGLTVVVLDEQPALGGQIYRRIESAPEAIQHILGADYVAGRALLVNSKPAVLSTSPVRWSGTWPLRGNQLHRQWP